MKTGEAVTFFFSDYKELVRQIFQDTFETLLFCPGLCIECWVSASEMSACFESRHFYPLTFKHLPPLHRLWLYALDQNSFRPTKKKERNWNCGSFLDSFNIQRTRCLLALDFLVFSTLLCGCYDGCWRIARLCFLFWWYNGNFCPVLSFAR